MIKVPQYVQDAANQAAKHNLAAQKYEAIIDNFVLRHKDEDFIEDDGYRDLIIDSLDQNQEIYNFSQRLEELLNQEDM